MKIKKVRTDGGKEGAGFGEDRNDCTVRALAVAANISYVIAHKIMEEEGRRPGHGASCFAGIINAKDKGLLRYTHIDLKMIPRTFNACPGYVGVNNKPILTTRFVGPTVRAFVLAHPEGRYILRIKKHVFAVVDGVIYDAFKPHCGSLVKAAYKIEVGGRDGN